MRIYNNKSSEKMNIEIKTIATLVIKNELKYLAMTEDNTCIVKGNTCIPLM